MWGSLSCKGIQEKTFAFETLGKTVTISNGTGNTTRKVVLSELGNVHAKIREAVAFWAV
jgi:hypothetical protein